MGTHLLPAALASFNEAHPGITLELHEAGGSRLLGLLVDGVVDLAIVPLPVAGVASEGLFTEELVIAVAAEHRLAGQPAVSAADLADEGFILFPLGYELRDRTLELCRSAGFEPRVVLDGGAMDTVLRFAAVGLGIAVLPRLALDDAAGLVGLPLAGQQLVRTLGLAWHPERQLPPAARALQHFLRAALAA